MNESNVIHLKEYARDLEATVERLDRRCKVLEFENYRLKVELGGGEVPAGFLGLSTAEAQIVAHLMSARVSTRRQLYGLLYEGRAQPGPSGLQVLSHHVRHARIKLAPYGIEIQTIQSTGYSMPGGSKATIRSLLERQTQGELA